MENKFHTVIFDLDGTLSNSALLTMTAFKNILPNHGLPIPSEEAVRRATGNATPEFYYILFPDFERDMVYNAGILVEQEELRLLPALGGKLLFNGCLDLLTRLKEYRLRLCIASTGEKDHVFSILNATGIESFFDIISCGRPDKKEMLREIIDNNDKGGYVMVGDMKKDYEGASANSILSVGACYGYCKRELTNFDLYIDAPLDLLSILKIRG
jgi:phosphoglycolate phosphatase